MNRTGFTYSAAAAMLVSLPAAAMLLSLPATSAVQAATVDAASPHYGSEATCDWTPMNHTGAGPSVAALPSGGHDKVTYAGSVADGGNLGPAPATSGGGDWHQVTMTDHTQPYVADVNSWDGAHAAGAHYGPGSACDWTPVYHTGAGDSVTALTSTFNGRVTYAAWDADRDHGRNFAYGISTNYGGRWHQLSMKGLPRQHIAHITVDSLDAAHAYAVYNEHSRGYLPGSSHCRCHAGDVFETWNGGHSWTDISGNLPSLVPNGLVLSHGRLALATSMGVYTAFESKGARTCWTHLGSGLPKASVEDLAVGPDNYIYAATHGHGTWRFKF